MPKRNRLTREGRRKLERKIESRMDVVEQLAKQFVPVDTGDLMLSIHWKKTDWGWIVGSKLDYASFVELGTRKMPAQPYLRPAAKQAFSQNP